MSSSDCFSAISSTQSTQLGSEYRKQQVTKNDVNEIIDTNNPANKPNQFQQNNAQTNNCNQHDLMPLTDTEKCMETNDQCINRLIDNNQTQTPCCFDVMCENSIDFDHGQNGPIGWPSTPSTTDLNHTSNGSISTNERQLTPRSDDDMITVGLQKCSLIDYSSVTSVTTATTAMAAPDVDNECMEKTSVVNGTHQSGNTMHKQTIDPPFPSTSHIVAEQRDSLGRLHPTDRKGSHRRQRNIVRRFQKLDSTALTSTPAPDVKIGQRVAYKEYYGSEFGTIRWIGRVPQISPDWTVGVEFDNAIGEGDGSLNGRRYFIAKDCFAKFLPLDQVAIVDQHVGRPEPGTMISVMSAAVRPGQMISIQRVSTVHVQHCFLNAPHRRPGAEFLAVNTRLHCQCPNCGPCAHVVKPPRTQRLRTGKNATHMCQFSTYTCCGMESQEDALCTYTGNRISSTPPPEFGSKSYGSALPPIGNSWIEGSGYLSNLQAQQSKLMPEEYRLGAVPEDIGLVRSNSKTSSRRNSGKHHEVHHDVNRNQVNGLYDLSVLDSAKSADSSRKKLKSDDDHKQERGDTLEHNNQIDRPPSYGSAQVDTCLIPDCKCKESGLVSNISSNGVLSKNDNELVLASLDKTAQISSTQSNYSNAKGCDKLGGNESTGAPPDPVSMRDTNAIETFGQTKINLDNAKEPIEEPKATRVVYRDSIENRYLFPTDDVIDSTLEADLENLSQARYGHCGGTQQIRYSRNIFRSLRSLVSCLSAKSNNSEMGRHSETTMSLYGRPTNELNKSQPIQYCNNEVASCGCERCESSSPVNAYHHHNQNEIRHENHTDCSASKTPPPPFDGDVDYLPERYEVSPDLEKNNSFALTGPACNNGISHPRTSWNPNSCNNGVDRRNQSRKFCGHQRRNFGSSGASSSHGCWSSCGCITGAEIRSTKTTAHSTTIEQQIRRQISSSSDCGFSSASQNSINFNQSPPSFSPINLAQDERAHMNQVYKKIAARLVSSNSTMTSEDLLKLKGALFDIHSESCCLHATCETLNHISRSTLDTSECDQVLADMIKKSYLDRTVQPVTDTGADDGSQMNTASNGNNKTDKDSSMTKNKSSSILSQCKRETGDADKTNDGISMKSSCPDVIGSQLELGKMRIDSVKNGGKSIDLPAAFELKLTLSINSDQVKSIQTDRTSIGVAAGEGEALQTDDATDCTSNNKLSDDSDKGSC